MTYQDYAAAHRKQQIDIWRAIESGEMQKAVDIFAAGIQYGSKPESVSTKRKRKKRRLIHKILKRLFTRVY